MVCYISLSLLLLLSIQWEIGWVVISEQYPHGFQKPWFPKRALHYNKICLTTRNGNYVG